ncbi:MAG TPA: AMP-binding protein [Acidimicrobiia bacterium]|nr:AMP-binding protein [Acidimicrobiia bacterium]
MQLLNGYGLTETTSAVVTNVGIEFVEHPDSVGRPNLTADLAIVDPDGHELGVGEVGELTFRSPQVVKGYREDEAATAAVFVDGWFHSGDVGFVDDEGYVYVVDRIKDVVIRGGENVYCAEVEALLLVDALPKTATEKVAKQVLREQLTAVGDDVERTW